MLYLALETGDGVVPLAPMLDGETGGQYPATLSVKSLEWRASPGRAPTLVGVVSSTDSYYEDGCMEDYVSDQLTVCAAVGSSVRCALVHLGTDRFATCQSEDADEAPTEEEERGMAAAGLSGDARLTLTAGTRTRRLSLDALLARCPLLGAEAFGCEAEALLDAR